MLQARHTSSLLQATPPCKNMMFSSRLGCAKAVLPAFVIRACRRSRGGRVCAENGFRERVDGVVRAGDRAATSVADLLPSSVPRGAAKVGVLAIGGLVAFSLLQKILSTFLFIGVLGGAAYLWLKLSGKDDSGPGGDGGNDALADAKRIMDKYR